METKEYGLKIFKMLTLAKKKFATNYLILNLNKKVMSQRFDAINQKKLWQTPFPHKTLQIAFSLTNFL